MICLACLSLLFETSRVVYDKAVNHEKVRLWVSEKGQYQKSVLCHRLVMKAKTYGNNLKGKIQESWS